MLTGLIRTNKINFVSSLKIWKWHEQIKLTDRWSRFTGLLLNGHHRHKKETQRQIDEQTDRPTENAPWEEWWPTKGQPCPKRRERRRGQGRRPSSKLNVLNWDSEIQFSCQSFLLATILNTFHTHTHSFHSVWADESEEKERVRLSEEKERVRLSETKRERQSEWEREKNRRGRERYK